MSSDADFPNQRIFCIDSVSFYASCECHYRNLPPLTTKLAVVSDLKRSGSVILAASPALKALGIKTASRLYQIEQLPYKDRKQIHLVEPRMLRYMKTSIRVLDVLHQFGPPEAIRVYSIDESFIDMTGTERLFGDDFEAAKQIQNAILEQTGIHVRIGIGPNNVIAKLALDLLGKKQGIARCGYADVPRLLHDFPIRKMWGIGNQMEHHLNRLGIETIGDLADAPLEMLHERFGVIGAELWHHAWGIDQSPTTVDPTALFRPASSRQKTIGHGVTLMRDYYEYDQIRLVLSELASDVAARVRFSNQLGWTVHLGVRYSRHVVRAGFSKQLRLPYPTSDERIILRHILQLFEPNWLEHEPIRFLSVSLGQLVPDQGALQLSLFEDNARVWKRKRLLKAIDHVNLRYGKGTIRLAVAFLDTSVAKRRLRFVGGHPGGNGDDTLS
ncbi:Y-family DNA polymerase [Exiguobacterium oxidotolerans]|uniref:Lesion bypass phage DNA polymerase phage SPbeta n=1 Tax=Exiguobacterium oxidotolerans TaxID=223958 RepID=A0A653I4B8_9BACL|nr:DNA polymerase [Exiguobacterium oxidotolerans]VWX33721.1 lesion bypass phage DNA polymerase; phage SPbeta [Exiguobacterium oxidotolerans]